MRKDLNLSIFGHCLASQHRVPLLPAIKKEFRTVEGKERHTLFKVTGMSLALVMPLSKGFKVLISYIKQVSKYIKF